MNEEEYIEDYEYVYYCRDCSNDWRSFEVENECSSCESFNIVEADKIKL